MAVKKLSCEFNRECWATVRLPIIKEAKRRGQNIYLPYQCSYVKMGDMEKCTLRDRFAAERAEREGVSLTNGELSTEGIS